MIDPAMIEDAARALEPETRRRMLDAAERALAAKGWTPARIDAWRPGFEREMDEGLVRKIAVALLQNQTRH